MLNDIYERFRYSFKLVYACAPWHTRWNLILTIFQSVLPLATVYLLKVLIDAVTAASGAPDDDKAVRYVLWMVLLTGLVFLLSTLTDSLKSYIQLKLQQYFYDSIFQKIHQTTTSIDVAYFEDDAYYNLFSRAIQNADSKPLQIVESSFRLLQFSISILTLGALLVSLHWSVPLLLLIAALPLGIAKVYYSNALHQWYQSNTQAERKIWDTHDVLTNAYFSRELRVNGLTMYFRSLFERLRSEVRSGYLSIIKRRAIVETFCLLFAAVAVFGALGYISLQSIAGILTVGGLAMYVMAIHRGVSFFQELLKSLAELYENGLYITYIQDFLALEPRDKPLDEGLDFPRNLSQGIQFKNVNFSYPKSSRAALKDFNIFIPAGKTVAIVGANGAGKSTMVKLLCGLYSADEGEILIDGVEIKELSRRALRENLGVLFQNFSRYNFSVRENIWFGDPHKPMDDQRIQDAARKAQVDKMISRLPYEYRTVLGRIYDNSEEISGGEWQKIGLARTFFKDSEVVILDEPTAALDPDAEYEIFSLFSEIVKDKTAIIISHRFSSVRMADYIYVLNDQLVEEHGTHAELMTKKGMYYRMFSKQAEAYV